MKKQARRSKTSKATGSKKATVQTAPVPERTTKLGCVPEDFFSAIRKIRSAVDCGTGSAIGGAVENSCAIEHRRTAHEYLTLLEEYAEGGAQ